MVIVHEREVREPDISRSQLFVELQTYSENTKNNAYQRLVAQRFLLLPRTILSLEDAVTRTKKKKMKPSRLVKDAYRNNRSILVNEIERVTRAESAFPENRVNEPIKLREKILIVGAGGIGFSLAAVLPRNDVLTIDKQPYTGGVFARKGVPYAVLGVPGRMVGKAVLQPGTIARINKSRILIVESAGNRDVADAVKINTFFLNRAMVGWEVGGILQIVKDPLNPKKHLYRVTAVNKLENQSNSARTLEITSDALVFSVGLGNASLGGIDFASIPQTIRHKVLDQEAFDTKLAQMTPREVEAMIRSGLAFVGARRSTQVYLDDIFRTLRAKSIDINSFPEGCIKIFDKRGMGVSIPKEFRRLVSLESAKVEDIKEGPAQTIALHITSKRIDRVENVGDKLVFTGYDLGSLSKILNNIYDENGRHVALKLQQVPGISFSVRSFMRSFLAITTNFAYVANEHIFLVGGSSFGTRSLEEGKAPRVPGDILIGTESAQSLAGYINRSLYRMRRSTH